MFRVFLKFTLLVLFFLVFYNFVLVHFLWAQELKIDASRQKTFADKLYQKKEYYRAISEYQRFLYFFPQHPFTLDSRLQIGKAYLAGKDYTTAISYWEELKKNFPTLDSNYEVNLYLAYSWMDKDSNRFFYYRQKNIKKALEVLQSISITNSAPKKLITSDIDSFIEEWEVGSTNLDKKSPWVAGTLSAIFPGSGSLYTKRYNEAIYAFFINFIFLGATLEANKSGDSAAVSILGFFALAFYAGNIYTAINGSYKYNDFSQTQYWNNLRTKHNLFFSP